MNTHLLRRLLIMLGLLLLSVPAQAVIWCHDYTIYRLTGEDPRPPGSEEENGSSHFDLTTALKKSQYTPDDITGLDAATVQKRLKPGDVIVVGEDHSAYVNADGGIDHFLQDPRERKKRKYAADALPHGPLLSPNGDAVGGLFLNETYADFVQHRRGKPTTYTLWHQSAAKHDEDLEGALARAKAILAECGPIAASCQKLSGTIDAHVRRFDEKAREFRAILSRVQGAEISGNQMRSFADALSLLSKEVEGGIAGIEKACKDLADVASAADNLAGGDPSGPRAVPKRCACEGPDRAGERAPDRRPPHGQNQLHGGYHGSDGLREGAHVRRARPQGREARPGQVQQGREDGYHRRRGGDEGAPTAVGGVRRAPRCVQGTPHGRGPGTPPERALLEEAHGPTPGSGQGPHRHRVAAGRAREGTEGGPCPRAAAGR